MKKEIVLFVLCLVLVSGCGVSGNDIDSATGLVSGILSLLSDEGTIEEEERAPPDVNEADQTVSTGLKAAQDNENSITIATFNIQAFGVSKRGKPEVMEILANTMRNFDIVAVQEFRDKSEETPQIFLDSINALDGATYEMVVGPRLGRSNIKEQYAFYYNSDKISYVEDSAYTYDDSDDVFEREPFLAQFSSGEFDFVLVNIHTKPDDATEEIETLADVYVDAQTTFADEEDIIVLGDYNADCSYHKDHDDATAFETASFVWVVPDDTDTTVKSSDCAYDRIVFSSGTTENYLDNVGVFLYDSAFGIDYELAVKVSDHYPVWAEFDATLDSE